MKTSNAMVCVLPLALLAGAGCAEYFTVEEACHPKGKVAGGQHLGAVEFQAMERMNCHRRLAGLTRASANSAVQAAAKGQISYIQANPDLDRVFGLTGPAQFLAQNFQDPGFTGANIFERLDAEQYSFVDPGGVSVDEYIQVTFGFQDGVPVGGEAVDELLRDAMWRQAILQPSWIDGAYTEAELNAEWLNAGDACKFGDVFDCIEDEVPPTMVARVHYLIAIHYAPHLEHTDKPVVYPKQDQLNVPVYSWSNDLSTIETVGRLDPGADQLPDHGGGRGHRPEQRQARGSEHLRPRRARLHRRRGRLAGGDPHRAARQRRRAGVPRRLPAAPDRRDLHQPAAAARHHLHPVRRRRDLRVRVPGGLQVHHGGRGSRGAGGPRPGHRQRPSGPPNR